MYHPYKSCNLTFLGQDPSAMVNRWSMALQELDYTVSYISGEVSLGLWAGTEGCWNAGEEKV